jgi:DNA polymerase elongation subunit (family B)
MAQSIDGKVLTFEELIQIPSRVSFLDVENVKACRTRLTEKKPIEFLPVHIWESYLPEKGGALSLDKFAYRMYKIIMFGIVKSGEKITVVLDNVLPFMELRVPRSESPIEPGSAEWNRHTHEFKTSVLAICREQGFKVKETHVITGATIREYDDRADFIQLCFSSQGERKKTVDFFDNRKYRRADGTEAPYETTHDDATCYYRMVSRDTLTPWTNWCTLRDYTVTRKHQFFNSLYTVHVDYRKVETYKGDIFADSDLRQDKTIELNWDIETRDPVETDEIPNPASATFDMPNISMSFVHPHGGLCPVNSCSPNDPKYDWVRPPGHLIQYNITTMMTPPMPNRTTIMCKNMSEMLMAFALIWRRMQPEYEITFNGHNYDWLCHVEKSRQLRLLEFLERNMSMADLALYRQIEDRAFANPKKPFTVVEPEGPRQWNGSYAFWKKYNFKISAELQNFPAACLNYPGYVCIDLMPQLRAACGNPEKYSLHKFLEMFQLGDKVEMPYKEMFARMEGNRRLLDMLRAAGLDDLHPQNIRDAAREYDEAILAQMKEGKPGCPTSTAQLYKVYKLNTGAHAADSDFPVRIEGTVAWAYGRQYSLESDDRGHRTARVRGNQLEIWVPGMAEAVAEAERDMLEVAEYCIVDGLRCHDLLVKTQFIPDKRLVGVLSYTTMDDCVYRANGMKVRNMIIAKAQSRRYRVSNRAPKRIETGKYPGAYVFPPKKGVATSKPSPAEMRGSSDVKYADWRNMSEADFERCLELIRRHGIWLENYLPAAPRDDTGAVDMNKIHPEQLEKYRKRAETAGQTVSEFLATFAGDLTGNLPAVFINWLKLDSHYPIAGLDFSSLYPSLIMTYNFSPEMMVHTLERALELAARGKKMHSVSFPFNGRTIKGWSVRHSYPEQQKEIDHILTRLRELSTTTESGRDDALEEEMRLATELERRLVDVEFGLFPTVLKDLFDQRVALKAQLKPIAHRIEELELLPKKEFARWIHDHADEWSLLMGRFNYLNSKQKALKVFMNTFYGESGNAMSPLRVLALAGGVTSGGQYNIKKVAQLVQDLGCRIYYGDSVTGDTPVLLKRIRGDRVLVEFLTFDSIHTWLPTQTEKDLSEEWNDAHIWTARGWARIRSVVRHRIAKRIYRVTTLTGLVDVTEDHSLLDTRCREVKPQALRVGTTELLHGSPITVRPHPGDYCIDNCLIMDPEKMTRRECSAFLTGYGFDHFQVIESVSRDLYEVLCKLATRATGRSVKPDFEDDYQDDVYTCYGSEFKPNKDGVLNGSLLEKMYFVRGVVARQENPESQSLRTQFSSGCIRRAEFSTKIHAAVVSHVARELGYTCLVASAGRCHYIVDIYDQPVMDRAVQTVSTVPPPYEIFRRISTGVTELEIDPEQWVYDITTDDGTFAAGVGDLIVKNTDSVYISMPRHAFEAADREYYSMPYSKFSEAGKVAYWEGLVTESFRSIKIINRAVNEALEADNGTRFLNMAFEEFLFPAAFFSKKKYCGIAHEGSYNANPKKIFVRGLEYVKKGVSEMLKDISKDILWEAFGVRNLSSIDEIVERMIEKIYTERNIEFDKFVKTASYRPNKKNVSVHTFHDRMEAIGMAPEPLDRFRYVIVKKYPFKYDLRGRKTPLSVGERMEYAERARQLGMEIDLDYYMSSNVCGQLARFISWRDDFHVEPRDDSDEAYNEAEKKNISTASKYIERCYEKWNEKHLSKGPALRTLYKKVNGVFHEEFGAIMRVSDIWQFDSKVDVKPDGDEKNRAQQTYEENQCMFQNVIQKVQQQVNRESKREAERLIAIMPLGKDIKYAVDKRNCYKGLLAQRKGLAARQLPMLHEQLRGRVQYLRKLFSKRDNILEQCISGLSATVGIEGENFDTLEPIIQRINGLDTRDLRVKINREIGQTVTHQDLLTLSDIDGLYLRLLSIHKLVRITEIVTNELDNFIHYKLGGVPVGAMNHLDDLDEFMEEHMGGGN